MKIGRLGPIVMLGIALTSGCGDAATSKKQDGGSNQSGECDGKNPCVDRFGAALCPVSSGFDGDDLALCHAKDEEEGISLHYGPKNYEDEGEIAKYLLDPYEEDENCVYVRTTNTKPVWVNGYHGRMRPLSHHLIVTIVDQMPEGVELGEPTRCNQAEAVGSRWLLGSQDPQIDIDIEGTGLKVSKPASPEDPEYGGGQQILPNTLLRIDMHYVNTTDKEVLREAWINLRAVPEEKVETVVDMITFFQFDIRVPPQSTGVKTAVGRCRAPSDRYVHLVTGHFHEHGTRFTVWHEKEDGATETVYDTRDWDVPGNAFYTDRIENPPMDGKETWGAKSGYLHVKKGEYINFQCEYENPSNTLVTFGELGKDQMCNVFGLYYPSNGRQWTCTCLGEACL